MVTATFAMFTFSIAYILYCNRKKVEKFESGSYALTENYQDEW